MTFLMQKGGITQEVISLEDVARLKRLGYVEIKPAAAAPQPEPPAEKTPEEENAEAIAEANKPAGSRKGRK